MRRMPQYQDGVKVLEYYEWRCEGNNRRFRKPKHTKEHFKKDSNRYILSKNLENCELFSAWGFRCDKLVKIHYCERNLLLMILTGNHMVYPWNKKYFHWHFVQILRPNAREIIPLYQSHIE